MKAKDQAAANSKRRATMILKLGSEEAHREYCAANGRLGGLEGGRIKVPKGFAITRKRMEGESNA